MIISKNHMCSRRRLPAKRKKTDLAASVSAVSQLVQWNAVRHLEARGTCNLQRKHRAYEPGVDSLLTRVLAKTDLKVLFLRRL